MESVIWIILCLGFFQQCIFSIGDHSVQYIGPNLVSEGDPFVLSCVTPFHDSSTWTLNGSVIITDENILGYDLLERRLYSFCKEMVLKTVSAQLYHTGEYRCNGNSRDYHLLRVVEDAENVTIEGTESPFNKHNKRDDRNKYPKRYYLEVNNNYQFSCEIEDEDYPVIWFKNMQQIDSFTYPNVELYDRHLIIHNAQVEDVGEYVCRLDALYQPGKRDVVSRYLLTSPAEIVDISEKQSVIRGRSMTLYCRAKGYPSPRLTWYIGNLNAFLLKEKDVRISIYSKREKNSNAYLTLRNMSDYDRGLYTCRAENGIKLEDGSKYHEKSVPVYVRANIIEPNEDEPGLGKILIPGEPLFLQCKTDECPLCSIVWFKEGEKLPANESYMFIDEENKSLIIHSASINDTGVYECAVNRELINVDLRATIKVQMCEDLLSEGFTIESICEMPLVESKAAHYGKSIFELFISVLLLPFWTRLLT